MLIATIFRNIEIESESGYKVLEKLDSGFLLNRSQIHIFSFPDPNIAAEYQNIFTKGSRKKVSR